MKTLTRVSSALWLITGFVLAASVSVYAATSIGTNITADGTLNASGSGTSTFSGGVSAAGLASSNGLSVSGGMLSVNGVIIQSSTAVANTSTYLKVNASDNVSTTDLNPGILIFGDSFGIDLGYDSVTGRYANRIFTQNFQDIAFARTAIGPTSQSSFTNMLVIKGDGSNFVGIGTSTPAVTLDVNGYVKILKTSTTTACSATIEGSMFYNQANRHFWGCDGTSWQRLDN